MAGKELMFKKLARPRISASDCQYHPPLVWTMSQTFEAQTLKTKVKAAK